MLKRLLSATIILGALMNPAASFAQGTVTKNDIDRTKEVMSVWRRENSGPLDPKKLFPVIVPDGYLKPPPEVREPPASLPLVPGLDVALVILRQPGEVPGLTTGSLEYVRASDLTDAKLGVRDAFRVAIENLATAAEKGELRASAAAGADGKPVMNSWSGTLAGSCVLLPGLHKMAAAALKTKEIVVSLPHREACLLFPAGGTNTPDQIKRFVREHEAGARKPITGDIFRLIADAKLPFFEHAPIAKIAAP
jgi:hypothetical protein